MREWRARADAFLLLLRVNDKLTERVRVSGCAAFLSIFGFRTCQFPPNVFIRPFVFSFEKNTCREESFEQTEGKKEVSLVVHFVASTESKDE
mmetsp:Transcript_2698/g.5576  ORF Transcript_2698/g.5576 Transcript_2698/m.5576 type:complete len:92 (+) Transcript_2698:69-344(+)